MRWLTVHVGGQRWAVDVLTSRSKLLVLDGKACEGVAHYDLCRIVIARDLPEQGREEALLHELLHAVNHVSGAKHALVEAMPDGDVHALEERMVRAITPVLHRLLKDLGFRFPKGPSTDA